MTTSDVIQKFFSRFGAGDLPGMLELCANEVDFTVQGSQTVPWTGHRTSPAEVAGFLRSCLEDVQTQKFDIERIIADGADAVVLGDFAHKVTSTGKIFASRFALRITVEGGKISRYHMFENSHGAAEAFSTER